MVSEARRLGQSCPLWGLSGIGQIDPSSARKRNRYVRALVTGATGFVGGHLCEHLVAMGDVVVGLSSSGCWPTDIAHLSRLIRLEQYDLAGGGEAELSDLLEHKKPEVIYHLAAQSNPNASLTDPKGTWALNLGGTLNLLEAVKHAALNKTTRVVLVSSGTCYGNPDIKHLPVREDCPVRPNNPYAASKAAGDLLGIQYYLAHGLETIMVRPFNHAGPRQSPLYVLSALAMQVARVETKQQGYIEVGNLEVTRDFTDVRDVVQAYRLLAQRGEAGEVYNLGSGQGTRLAAALDHLTSLAQCSIEIRVDPARIRQVDLPLLVADATKLRAQTSWEPRYGIEQTLADMLETYRVTVRQHPRSN
jgi:GDP-4-dehydro-6-deoxy-D-mannose reductase